MRSTLSLSFVAALCGLPACGATATPREQALLDVKSFIDKNLDDLRAAAAALAADAPAPDADGWSSATDGAAVEKMKADWRKARAAYEHIEGSIAVLFPELDVSTDARYDDFIATGGDDDLFDDQGVTGIHAIERILWSDSIPDRVKTFEAGLPGYKAAAFPSSLAEATEFKTKLCARLVTDIDTMRSQFQPLALDPAAAYRGVIGSMNEQVEKANKAATGEEESRYAQYTLADMRANVAAGVETYQAFRPWLLGQGGADLDTQISAGFQKVQDRYSSLPGDAIPTVPATWSTTSPSADDLATPFGQLYSLLASESNPDTTGSLVQTMTKSADLLGIAQLPQ
jgi:iron uptake system component EfeO